MNPRVAGLAAAGTILAVASGCASAPKPVRPPSAVQAPAAAPVEPLPPAAPPAASPGVPTAVGFVEVPEPRLDVSILTDQSSFVLPAGDYRVRAPGLGAQRRRGPLRFSARGGNGGAAPLFVVQAGSFGTRAAAETERARVAALVGVVTEIAENAGRFAVRAGPPSERASADVLLRRVRRDASPDAFVVGVAPAGVPAAAPMVLVDDDGAAFEALSPVEIASPDGSPLPAGEGSWRGHLLVRATGRGTLHVMDRVNLEEYLRGVVPAEMGPKVYDELEALKAQAIAARSYAVRHRGDFAAEGYDLCATPRCQAYAGTKVESPLSDQAVAETAGEVLLWNGAVADTLFTSTCGGRTEAAAEVFPGYASLDVPYLAAVSCFGETPVAVVTARHAAKGELSLLAVRGRALFASLDRADASAASLALARAEVRDRLGLPPVRPLAGLSPDAVYADVLDLGAFGDTGLLLEETEIAAAPATLAPRARIGWALLARFQLAGPTGLPVERRLAPEEAAGLWASLLLRQGALEETDGRLLGFADGTLTLKTAKGRIRMPLAHAAALFRGSGDSWTETGSLVVHPGDRVRAFVRDGEAAALALTTPSAAGTYERDSSWIHWTRRFTGTELFAKLKERDPARAGRTVRRVEVLERSPGGRTKKVRVTTDTSSVTLTGLEVRFALAIPENLFTLATGRGADGDAVFTFYGRGWGHGVGLCQNGAFGMALAGKDYREILGHYYPGATVGLLPSPSSR